MLSNDTSGVLSQEEGSQFGCCVYKRQRTNATDSTFDGYVRVQLCLKHNDVTVTGWFWYRALKVIAGAGFKRWIRAGL